MQVLLRFADQLADGSVEVDVVEIIAPEQLRISCDMDT